MLKEMPDTAEISPSSLLTAKTCLKEVSHRLHGSPGLP